MFELSRKDYIMASVAASATAALIVTAIACAPVKDAGVVAQLVGCVLAHEDEPVAQIAVDCAAAVADVEKILEAHRMAEARERAVDGGSSKPGMKK